MLNTLPKQNALPTARPLGLTIRPLGVEIYTDLQRGKRFVRLSYRRRDVTQSKALTFVAEVLADVTRAGLVVTGDVESALSLENTQGKARVMQSPATRCKMNVKVQVEPAGEQPEDAREWAEWLRAQYAPAGEEKDGAGEDQD